MQYLTQEIYRASRPDALQPLFDMTGGGPERQALAQKLEDDGYVIDKGIDVYGWAADLVMAERLHLGLKTAPAANENLPGSIKVSIDAADYPPIHPAAAPIPPVTATVGAESPTPGVYTWTPADFDGHGKPIFPEGAHQTAPDGKDVIFNIYKAAPFGNPGWRWETAAARAKRQAEEGTAIDNAGQRTGGAVQA